jgi:anti-sigma B factor antagonist
MHQSRANGNLAPASAEVRARPDGVVVVTVIGEFDMVTSRELEHGLAEAIEAGDGEVVVDLHACTFADSSALGALVRASQRLEQLGRRLRVERPRPHVRRAIEMIGLERMLGLKAAG